MNRSLANVILGGYTQTGKAALVEGTAVETTVESTVEALTQARSVIIVPGCGPRARRAPAGARRGPALTAERCRMALGWNSCACCMRSAAWI